MTIIKHVIQITILREADFEGDAAPLDEHYSLQDIAANIENGPWLGQMAHVSTGVVDPDRVADECKALGNDGAFFDYDGDLDLMANDKPADDPAPVTHPFDSIQAAFFDGLDIQCLTNDCGPGGEEGDSWETWKSDKEPDWASPMYKKWRVKP